jgi:cell division protein FtsQ
MIAVKSLSWIGLVALFIYVSIAAMHVSEENRCDKIRVIFSHDKNLEFIHSKDIIKEVHDANPAWKGQKMNALKADIIENSIRENDYVKTAEVYLDFNKHLNVYIEPKAPIARIHDGGYSYYISENWDKMPLSTNFSKRVVHVTGRVQGLLNPKNLMDSFVEKELKIFLNYASKNDIWTMMVDQVYITPQGKFELYLTFTDAVIKIGFIGKHFEKRMEKVSTFFKIAPYYKNLSEYSTLDFQYSQQVIAMRKEAIQTQ